MVDKIDLKANDLTLDVDTSDDYLAGIQKEQRARQINKEKDASPVAATPAGLNEQLVEMTKRGLNTGLFSGIERCIRILDKGANNQRHCMGMVVTDNVHGKHCSACQRPPNPGVCNPKVINSSMIKLNDKELAECGLSSDPTYVDPKTRNVQVHESPVKQKRTRRTKEEMAAAGPRRTIVKTPNKVSIEMSMDELKANPNVLAVMLQKTLEAIYELPVSTFREAEEIRVVKERVEEFLSYQGGKGE